ncbi:PadR family transcriptional regulator [Candidatus Woesearchaeota archaeon]|nr:PadR family transcriptional regulator [Candidatus Woesearchaeota archaeon]
MQKLKINSIVKLHTLCLLSKGPKHGYEIIKELENTMDQSISASHVYPFLKSLEKNKFIACKIVEERDKKRYDLTKNGQQFVNLVLENLGSIIESVIEKRLSTCTHCRCKVYNSGHKETIKNHKRIFCCEHCADAFKEKMLLNV